MQSIGLSKSRLTAFEQCPKRVWLQVHQRDAAQFDQGSKLRFAAGHEVGDAACLLHPDGLMIAAEPDLAAALEMTATVLAAGHRAPLFEATFAYDGVLVRVDVMEPGNAGCWHVAEVKSSSSRKGYHLADLATQIWVMREAGIHVETASIRHINNQFVLEEIGNYRGLFLNAASLTAIEPLILERPAIVASARAVLAGPEPQIPMGAQCTSPFSCEFREYCSQGLAAPDWPIALLPNTGKRVAAEWAEQDIFDLREIPEGGLPNAVHARIHQATLTGEPFHDVEGARRAVSQWSFPRTFLDFETIAFAVPRWLGTKPWEQVPFQFSAHVENAPGAITHREFLSIDGTDPRRACALALIDLLPFEGAIIAYNASFEKSCLKRLADRFEDLSDALHSLADRIVDLLPVTRQHWYHRDQRGSWSIKAVLPTIGAGPGYEMLAVQDGTAAQSAYIEAVRGGTSEDRRLEISAGLKAYCRQDTQAMIDLLQHLTRP